MKKLVYSACGRTELGGNHTDHQNGQVLGEDGVCRVHGGGFAGTIQAFVKDSAVDRYKAAMDKLFGDGACMVMRFGCDSEEE